MTDADLALSALRKIIRGDQDPLGVMYVKVDAPSVCIDGWSDDLTPDELALVNRILTEERAAAELAWTERTKRTGEHQ